MIEEAILKLKSFDLSQISDEVIRQTIKEFGKTAIMRIIIKPGQAIYRGRSDKELIPRRRIDEISYIKDPKVVPQYNRASLQGTPLFYGVLENEDRNFCQTITNYEVTQLDNESTLDGAIHEEYITMGRWIVKTEIELAAIVYNVEYCSTNPMLNAMFTDYKKFIGNYPDQESGYFKIAEYLAYEFSKRVKETERYNYKISAAFAEEALSFGLHGILFPTAKGEGKVFNIALKPEIVDSHLEFARSLIWWNRKKNKNILMLPFLGADSFNERNEFIWHVVENWTPEHEQNQILNR